MYARGSAADDTPGEQVEATTREGVQGEVMARVHTEWCFAGLKKDRSRGLKGACCCEDEDICNPVAYYETAPKEPEEKENV
jgi:hypothetical protein